MNETSLKIIMNTLKTISQIIKKDQQKSLYNINNNNYYYDQYCHHKEVKMKEKNKNWKV